MNERLRKLDPRLAELMDKFRSGTLDADGEAEVWRLTGGMSPKQALLFMADADDVVIKPEEDQANPESLRG
jgi:hypothetical protein